MAKRTFDDLQMDAAAGLQPCKIRRNYLCKECDYATTNPREFLYHQRDTHGHKGSIHECPYCVYASPHSHKLNRHVSIIHSPARSSSTHASPVVHRRPVQPPPAVIDSAKRPFPLTPDRRNSRPPYRSFTSVSLPAIRVVGSPPALKRQTTRLGSNGSSPELEVILLEEEEEEEGREDEELPLKKKTVRQLLMEPAKADPAVLRTIPPMPKLVRGCRPRPPISVTRRPPKPIVMQPARLLAKKPLLHKEYSCSLCSFRSRSTIVVQQHEKVFHLKKKFFRCSRCNYVTNVRSRYTKHLRYHSMPYVKCDLCDFSTPYKWNLDRHLRYHLTGTGLESFRCHRCSFLATSGQSLNMHVLNHHGGKPRPRRIECQVDAHGLEAECEAEAEAEAEDDSLKENDDELAAELKLEMEDDEQMDQMDDDKVKSELTVGAEGATSGSSIYTCSECEDRFSSVPLLDRHMYECHDIDNPRIPLKRANPNSSSPSSAAARFRDSKNVVQCDICSYKAKWVSEMVKHRRVHTQDKPYACVQCKFRTRWKGDMTRHMMRYHQEGSKAGQDGGASTATDNIDSLLDQSMTVGGEGELCIWSSTEEEGGAAGGGGDGGNEQDIPLDLSLAAGGQEPSQQQQQQASIRLSSGKIVHKKYACPHCDFVTPTPSRFHMHIVAHINPKPYMCSECGYRSNWQWDITKHSKMKSIRDRAHLSASVVCVNEYGSTNYERYEQYAVYDMENSSQVQDGDCAAGSGASKDDDPEGGGQPAMVPRRITYKCKHCDFKNPVKKMVVRHMVVHSGANKQKRFCCGVCGHASHWKYIVLRHCHHVHGTSGPILLKDSSPASPPTREDVQKATAKDCAESDGEAANNNKEEQEETDMESGSAGGTNDDELPKDEPSSSNHVSDDALKDKRHKCSICPYRCRKVFDLRIHSYLHRPREGAIFKCFFCPFYVSLKRSWLNHMRLHVDQPQDYAKQLLGGNGGDVEADSATDGAASGSGAATTLNPLDVDVDLVEADEGDVENPAGVPRVWVNRGGMVQKMFKCRHCPHVSKKRSVIVTHEGMHRNRNVNGGKATYKCPHCNYTAMNAGVLTSHQKVHQGDNAVQSYVGVESTSTDNNTSCETTTSVMSVSTTMEDGRVKMRIKKTQLEGTGSDPSNSSKGLHSCGECPAMFTKLRQMLNHRTFHGAALPWQCDHCSYAAKHRPHLHRHERVHTAEYRLSFEPATASTRAASVEEDVQSLDDSDQPLMLVDIGDATSIDLDQPWRARARPSTSVQQATIMKPVERKYRCQMCPAVFLKYSTLVYHMHLHNNNGKYRCSHCTYSVSNVGNLARHSKIHESAATSFDDGTNLLDLSFDSSRIGGAGRQLMMKRSKGRFACSKCPAVFDKQVRYNVHINLHGSAHRFHCDRCDYAVKFAAILIRHKALHDIDEERSASALDLAVSRRESSSSSPSNFQAPSEHRLESSVVVVRDDPSSSVEYDDVAPSSVKDSGFSSLERQQLLLQALQSKPMAVQQTPASSEVATVERAVASTEQLKKLFCCDRCPYVHQRKDAVQSHLKRHMSSARDSSSFCPHCDYGTTIHSFLREHMKLHFKPFVQHQPEGFARLEEFQVWAQSSLWKTLVYQRQFHASKDFGAEDVVELSLDELVEKLKLKSEASDVAAVVFELLNKVERHLEGRGRDHQSCFLKQLLQTNAPGSANSRGSVFVGHGQRPIANVSHSRLFECLTGASSSSAVRHLATSSSSQLRSKLVVGAAAAQVEQKEPSDIAEADFLEFALGLGFSA